MYELTYGDRNNTNYSTRTTRSSGENHCHPWAGVDKKDFGDTLTKRAFLYNADDDKDAYDRKNADRLIFNELEVKKWVKSNNKSIRIIARKRFLGLLD